MLSRSIGGAEGSGGAVGSDDSTDVFFVGFGESEDSTSKSIGLRETKYKRTFENSTKTIHQN